MWGPHRKTTQKTIVKCTLHNVFFRFSYFFNIFNLNVMHYVGRSCKWIKTNYIFELKISCNSYIEYFFKIYFTYNNIEHIRAYLQFSEQFRSTYYPPASWQVLPPNLNILGQTYRVKNLMHHSCFGFQASLEHFLKMITCNKRSYLTYRRKPEALYFFVVE